jgi:hypothetical protein
MYTSLRGHQVPIAQVLRSAAAACGAILVLCWVGMFVFEGIRLQRWIPNFHSHNQALVLVLVFASYAIGWRHELIGGLVAIVGTVAFFQIGYVGANAFPPLPVAWLASPGVLCLLAWITATDDTAPTRTPQKMEIS